MGRRLRIEPPMVLADELERRLAALPEAARAIALEELAPAIAANDPVAVARVLGEFERRLVGVVPDAELEAAAAAAGEQARRYHGRVFFGALGAAVGLKIVSQAEVLQGRVTPRAGRRGVLMAKLWGEPRLLSDRFATENALRIKVLRGQIVPALRDEVVRAVQFGITPEEAAKRLYDKWRDKGVPVASGNLEPRLRQTVRDQIAKLNTQLTRASCQAAGIDRFKWRSMGDDRVRELHEAINGNEYSFAEGHPTEGLPGEPPNCRCEPEAVVDRERVVASPGFIFLGEAEVEIAA